MIPFLKLLKAVIRDNIPETIAVILFALLMALWKFDLYRSLTF